MPEIFDGSPDHSKKGKHKAHSADHGKTSAENAEHPTKGETKRSKHVDEYSTVMRHAHPSHNPLDAFAAKPVNVCFDSQLADESILLLLRRHPFTQIGWVLIVIGLLLLPFLFSYVGLLNFLPLRFHFAALLGWYLMVTGFALESFLMWFFNVYIVTDERIIDVDFYSLLYKNISSAKIDNIEDITAVTGGAMGSIFNYGTIKIQTAAAVGEFEFEDVPQPDKVTAFLNEMLVEEEVEKLEGRTR